MTLIATVIPRASSICSSPPAHQARSDGVGQFDPGDLFPAGDQTHGCLAYQHPAGRGAEHDQQVLIHPQRDRVLARIPRQHDQVSRGPQVSRTASQADGQRPPGRHLIGPLHPVITGDRDPQRLLSRTGVFPDREDRTPGDQQALHPAKLQRQPRLNRLQLRHHAHVDAAGRRLLALPVSSQRQRRPRRPGESCRAATCLSRLASTQMRPAHQAATAPSRSRPARAPSPPSTRPRLR